MANIDDDDWRAGTVRTLYPDRGFGWLDCGALRFVFLHATAFELDTGNFQTLSEGDRVEVVITTTPKGPRAAKARLIDDGA